ncbi:PREDICTED: neuromodulin [Pygoscelis adeliae]|uniref:neuromodulin n=1 Tax=Pygoscelis adeliae TaxID=9238 RepID=UPI0004F4D8F2|nr:PREDICTED: neuromodulin [Pygoscelis adeliae]
MARTEEVWSAVPSARYAWSQWSFQAQDPGHLASDGADIVMTKTAVPGPSPQIERERSNFRLCSECTSRAHIGNSTVPGSRCDLPVAHLLASVKRKSLWASVSSQYSQEHEGSCAEGRVRAGRQQGALSPPLSGVYGLKNLLIREALQGESAHRNHPEPCLTSSWGLAWGTTPALFECRGRCTNAVAPSNLAMLGRGHGVWEEVPQGEFGLEGSEQLPPSGAHRAMVPTLPLSRGAMVPVQTPSALWKWQVEKNEDGDQKIEQDGIKPEDKAHKAATKIQASFRGHITRKKLKGEKKGDAPASETDAADKKEEGPAGGAAENKESEAPTATEAAAADRAQLEEGSKDSSVPAEEKKAAATPAASSEENPPPAAAAETESATKASTDNSPSLKADEAQDKEEPKQADVPAADTTATTTPAAEDATAKATAQPQMETVESSQTEEKTDAVEETKPTESAQQEEVKEEESKADQENA